MSGADICFEIVKRASEGTIFSHSINVHFFTGSISLAVFTKKRWQISKKKLWEVNQLKILRFENPMKFTSGQPQAGSSQNNDVGTKNATIFS